MQRLILETDNRQDFEMISGFSERLGMTKVNDDITTILLDDDTRIEIAVLLFTLEKFTLGQASLFIGIDQIAMQHILKERDVPLHYGDDEFEQGLKGLELL